MKHDHAVDFRDFTPDSRRLDTFLGNYMQDHLQFATLWDIFKMLLTISHGQSLNEQQRKKWKGVQLSIREAERKKSKVDTSIDILGKEADDLAKSAEAKHDFTLLTKSNALRVKVAQQSQETPKLEKELKELKKKLKSLE